MTNGISKALFAYAVVLLVNLVFSLIFGGPMTMDGVLGGMLIIVLANQYEAKDAK